MEHEIQFLNFSPDTGVSVFILKGEEIPLEKKIKTFLLAQEPDFSMTFFLCLFFTLSGCKLSLTNEHLEYIREFIISFLLNNPYHFHSILSFLKMEELTCIQAL